MMRLKPVPDAFADDVSWALHPPADTLSLPRLEARHGLRPDAVIRRPWSAPPGAGDYARGLSTWIDAETRTEMTTALWALSGDAYVFEQNKFDNHPVSLAEVKSYRAEDAKEWKPRDVLIDLLRKIDQEAFPNLDALVVMWREKDDIGVSSMYAVSSPDIHITLGMLARTEFTIQSTAVYKPK